MQEAHIDNSTAADRLIAAHDGDVALLYIFVRRTGCRDLEKAAGALCRTLQDLRAAEEKLRRMGLWEDSGKERSSALSEQSAVFVPPADELPSYTAEEITRLAAASPGFEDIRREATLIKGKQLTSHELGVLIGLGDHLGLPAEVVLELLHFCAEKAALHRPGGRPGFRLIEQEAFHWANLEILTFEQAEEYIRRQRDRSSALGRIQTLLGLQGRALTAREREHIESWLDMGFAEDAIQLAYELTVYKTNSLKWPYMNAILRSWHEAGLHDRKAVEAKERTYPGSRKTTPGGTSATPVDLGELEKFLENM